MKPFLPSPRALQALAGLLLFVMLFIAPCENDESSALNGAPPYPTDVVTVVADVPTQTQAGYARFAPGAEPVA